MKRNKELITWKAEYIGSYVDVTKIPTNNLPQIAVIGRSNVGKSSFINSLCNEKELARTSSKPGKTQTLNYYKVAEKFYLVDMPGYGFAKVSKTMRGEWSELISSFLKQDGQLRCLLLLIDANLPPQKADIEFINFCGESGIPIIIVRTKVDKSKPREIDHYEKLFTSSMLEQWEEMPVMVRHSAHRGEGTPALRQLIEKMILNV